MFGMFDSDLTKHLAQLSKIEFTDEELEKMTGDMTDITALMDKVCEFNNNNVNPYVLEPVDYNDLRTDKHADSYSADKITGNAKKVKNDSFAVPKVV